MSTLSGTIGSSPYNATRMTRLNALHDAGYRGKVSVTAYFAADIYDVDDDGVHYDGRYRYGAPGYMAQNYGHLYTRYVTSARRQREALIRGDDDFASQSERVP